MATQHFFVRGQYYGKVERGAIFAHAERAPAYGFAFFCPLCCELWAQCPVEGEAATVHSCPCEKHKVGETLGSWSLGTVSPLHLPGSLMLSYDAVWNSVLPTELLAREFLIHYQYAVEQERSYYA